MFICAGECESFAFAKPIGIGLIRSAINLTQLILRENPSELVFVGTAGSYDFSTPIYSILESYSATQIELSLLENNAYTPLENVISIDEEMESPRILDDLHSSASQNPHLDLASVSRGTNSVVVNSSNYITTSKTLASRMLNLGISLENMEFYSVLEMAKYFQIPTRGVFCVTNYSDSHAHDSFIANHTNAMQRLDSYIRERYAKHL